MTHTRHPKLIDLGDREGLILLAVALAIRCAWWAVWASVLENEGISYARIAENWLSGVGYVNTRGAQEIMIPPGYPGLIAGFSLVVRDFELAARLVSLVSGLFMVLLLRDLTRRAFGPASGRVAGVFAALHPVLVALSVSAYTEGLAMALTLAAVFFAIGAVDEDSVARAAASGAMIGLGYLTRPELIVLIGPVALYLVVSRLRARRWRSGTRDVLAALVVALSLAAPYSLYLSRQAGAFRWEGKSGPNEIINDRISRGMSLMQASRGLDVDRDFDRHMPYLGGPDLGKDQAVIVREAEGRPEKRLGDLFAAVPQRAFEVAKLLKTAASQWGTLFKLPVGLLLFLLSVTLTRWWKRSGWLEAALLFCVLALQTAVLLGVLFLWLRYAYPLVSLVIPWVSSGAVWLFDVLLRRLKPALGVERRSGWTVLLAAGVVAAMSFECTRRVAWIEDFRQSTDTVVRDAGLWLRSQRPPSGRPRPLIMDSRGAVMHYAGGTLTLLPYTEDVPRVLRYIHWKRPDFIVLSSQQAAAAPYIEAWLKRGIPDDCAVFLRRFESDRGSVGLWRWSCRD